MRDRAAIGARGGACRTLEGVWPRWFGRGFLLLVALAIAVGVVVLVPAKLVGWDVAGPDRIGDAYALTLYLLPFSWLLYMATLAVAGRRVRRHRRLAVALT